MIQIISSRMLAKPLYSMFLKELLPKTVGDIALSAPKLHSCFFFLTTKVRSVELNKKELLALGSITEIRTLMYNVPSSKECLELPYRLTISSSSSISSSAIWLWFSSLLSYSIQFHQLRSHNTTKRRKE